MADNKICKSAHGIHFSQIKRNRPVRFQVHKGEKLGTQARVRAISAEKLVYEKFCILNHYTLFSFSLFLRKECSRVNCS